MNNDKINVMISPVAFMKMQTLVMGFDKEVGWYCTAERIEGGFRVKDVLVFPQYTSATYIDDERDDPLEFRKWLDTLSDEDYNSRRLWGHSHVNMGVFPSGVDTNMFKRFKDSCCVEGIPNRFTLCLIMNKKLQMYWWAFDADANKEYKNQDINVMIEVEEGVTNLEFFENSKALVRDIYPTTAFLFGGRGASGYGYQGYAGGYNYGTYNGYAKEKEKKTAKPSATTAKTTTATDIYDDYGDPWYDYDDWRYDTDNGCWTTGKGSTSYKGGSTTTATATDAGSTKDESGSTEALPPAKDPIPIDAAKLRDYRVTIINNGKVNVYEKCVTSSKGEEVVFDTQPGVYNGETDFGNSYSFFSTNIDDHIPEDESECVTVFDYILYHYYYSATSTFTIEKSGGGEVKIASAKEAEEIFNSKPIDCEDLVFEEEGDKEEDISRILLITI